MRLNKDKSNNSADNNQSDSPPNSLLSKKALQHFNLRRRIKLSPNLKKGLLSFSALALLVGIISVSRSSEALLAPQGPRTTTAIAVGSDGAAPFDGTTGPAVPGTDDSANNGVVRARDTVMYDVEVSLNDANDTNITTTVDLESGFWVNLPAPCLRAGSGATPVSELVDADNDGVAERLICNVGDANEGSKIYFQAGAIASGNNGDTITANAVSTSDNSVQDLANNPANTLITASFGVSIDKSVASLSAVDEIHYVPGLDNPSPHGRVGQYIDWHVDLSYDAASEQVQDDGNGRQSFTFTDTWVGSHSNDPSVNSDNANGDFDDGLEIYGSITGDAADSCAFLEAQTAVPAPTITCTQAGPGQPITIQVDDVPVNGSSLARFSVRVFYPYDTVFDPNGFDDAESYAVDNTVELTGWGGTGAQVTSTTGIVDAGPEVDSEDWAMGIIPPGNVIFYKTFDSVAEFKSGARAAARGDVVETTLQISDHRSIDTNPGICDTLDTTVFEYAGFTDIDAIDHGNATSTRGYHSVDGVYGNSGSIHGQYNPVIFTSGSNLSANRAFTGDQLNATDYGVTIEFSDVSYAASGDDHWSATCEDDLDGNGSYDWVTDPVAIGGNANVVRVRLTWDRDRSAILADSHPAARQSTVFHSFNLLVKDTAPLDSYIANTASTYDADDEFWDGNWADPVSNQEPGSGAASSSDYVSVEQDPNDPVYGYTVLTADRVYVLPADMSVKKEVSDGAPTLLKFGEATSFDITPWFTASGATGSTNITLTDTFPTNGLAYVGDNCEAVYPGCTVSIAGNQVTYSFTHTFGDPMPAITVDAAALEDAALGTYVNSVTIASDYSSVNDDSFCDDAIDPAACRAKFSLGRDDSASVQVADASGVSINKTDSDELLLPQTDYVTELNIKPFGDIDLGQGQLIDVLPYNGDGVTWADNQSSPQRHNFENPANPNNATRTEDISGRARFVSVTGPGDVTYEYTTAASSTIDMRPCHPSNWPAGSLLGGGNATLDEICGLGLINDGTGLNDPTTVGTGSTAWGPAPANPGDVTAFRASIPARAAGAADDTITLTMNTGYVFDEDLLCNNFAYNSAIVTLDIFSNDVCVAIIAADIGDYVWWDINSDGVQDPFEIPIPNVRLTMLDGNNQAVLDQEGNLRVAFTDENGMYLFEGFGPGNYQVVLDSSSLPKCLNIPTYDFDTVGDNSSRATVVYDAQAMTIEDDLRQDFGYAGCGSLGDYVWLDANNDGVQDADEEPIEGVELQVTWAGPDDDLSTTDDNITVIATTDADGRYLADGLICGLYEVTVNTNTLPANLGQTYDRDGTLDNSNVVTLEGEDCTDLDNDFGYSILGSLGDYVWLDANQDGVQDADEEPIEGVEIVAVWAGPDGNLDTEGDNKLFSDVTDANGLYLVDEIPCGLYMVTVNTSTLPEKVIQTYDIDGTLDHRNQVTLLAPDCDNFDNDFGYYLPEGFLGDYVWMDANNDGVQDADEEPIEGVELQVTWAGQDNDLATLEDNKLYTAVTDAEGLYLVDQIPCGLYRVMVNVDTLPKNLAQTFDIDGTLDHTNLVTLEGDECSNLDNDFGYYPDPLAQTGSNTMILTLLVLGAITALGSVVSFRAYGRAV